ncbi:uncharacterized protein RAG0_09851 [Rhynchosporium agropyri]|uniref:Uncharacterized protein n=1 Tax=Rhynchosporium agropyri TaxID=914238 RepID=A0A1E1KXA0_9HELO|nr:uncharacterized protein RAG0_09851 [Rhynchosporium agropyri]
MDVCVLKLNGQLLHGDASGSWKLLYGGREYTFDLAPLLTPPVCGSRAATSHSVQQQQQQQQQHTRFLQTDFYHITTSSPVYIFRSTASSGLPCLISNVVEHYEHTVSDYPKATDSSPPFQYGQRAL